MRFPLKIIKSICRKHKIKLLILNSDKDVIEYTQLVGMDGWENRYINASYAIGKQIVIGKYKNIELKTISFFHELGHILITLEPTSKVEQEITAWQIGFAIAKIYNIKFSDKTIAWVIENIESYK